MPRRILSFEAIDPSASAVFGGKACGLARLVAAEVRVPAGFVVEATISDPGSWPEIDRNEFRRRTESLLANGKAAVRSSAIGEDAPDRSFAGLFETVLGIDTPDTALSAAGLCIASGGSERVRVYAHKTGPIPVAVIVQKQVDAHISGICFTVDPMGKDKAVLIEAVSGLGNRAASGHAEPERWRVYHTGLGTWDAHVDGKRRPGEAVLSQANLSAIAGEAMVLSDRLREPLDLEWSLDRDGRLWWLQARPITAAIQPRTFVIERCVREADDGPVTVWSNWNVRETLPEPVYPLTWSIWRDEIVPMVGCQLHGLSPDSPALPHLSGIDLVHGRLYLNVNALLAPPLIRLFARGLGSVDARAGAAIHDLVRRRVLRPRRLPVNSARLMVGLLIALPRSIMRLINALPPRRSFRRLAAAGIQISRRGSISEMNDDELIQEMCLIAHPECREIQNGLQMEGVAMLVFHLALRAFKKFPEAQRLLASGIRGTPTTEISIELDELIQAACPISRVFLDPLAPADLFKQLEKIERGRQWLVAFHDFLSRVGHRGPGEFDIGVPRWSEDPTMLLDLIRAGLRSRKSETLKERLEILAARRRDAISSATLSAPWWRRAYMQPLAHLVELYMPNREAPKHYGMFAFMRMRQAACELGSRLVVRGMLTSPEEVFFLEYSELKKIVREDPAERDLQQRIATRRTLLEQFRSEQPPDMLRSDGVPVVDEESVLETPGDGVLRGTAVSSGVATGPVRILREPDPNAMEDGDVIVMEYADPGWTPLFPRAAAVVMEVGGMMCHAAVVARELGIPAVFGLRNATRLLNEGQSVTVDGNDGIVRFAWRTEQEASADQSRSGSG